MVFDVSPVSRTENDDIGWFQGIGGIKDPFDTDGTAVDLRGDSIVVDFKGEFDNSKFFPFDENLMERRVFNIEVEDFHTYYVGELGVWVHNSNSPRRSG